MALGEVAHPICLAPRSNRHVARDLGLGTDCQGCSDTSDRAAWVRLDFEIREVIAVDQIANNKRPEICGDKTGDGLFYERMQL